MNLGPPKPVVDTHGLLRIPQWAPFHSNFQCSVIRMRRSERSISTLSQHGHFSCILPHRDSLRIGDEILHNGSVETIDRSRSSESTKGGLPFGQITRGIDLGRVGAVHHKILTIWADARRAFESTGAPRKSGSHPFANDEVIRAFRPPLHRTDEPIAVDPNLRSLELQIGILELSLLNSKIGAQDPNVGARNAATIPYKRSF
jgi:hypothetical protein